MVNLTILIQDWVEKCGLSDRAFVKHEIICCRGCESGRIADIYNNRVQFARTEIVIEASDPDFFKSLETEVLAETIRCWQVAKRWEAKSLSIN
jgi:hypothetical protein